MTFFYYDDNEKWLSIMITEACNSNCIMCPMCEQSRRKAESISEEQIDEVIDLLTPEIRHIDITGGEPFLEWKKMEKLLKEINIRCPKTPVLILTNGRALCIPDIQKSLSFLITEQYRFAIPIHSYTKQRHDSICRAPGSYEQTMAGLYYLSTTCAQIEIRIVLHKINMYDITKTAQMLIEANIPIHTVNFIGMEMHGCAEVNRSILWVDYQKLFFSAIEGIILFIKREIDVGIYGFPLCQMPKWAWPLGKKAISAWKVAYDPDCINCTEQESCGGMFESTYKLGLCNVKPIGG